MSLYDCGRDLHGDFLDADEKGELTYTCTTDTNVGVSATESWPRTYV